MIHQICAGKDCDKLGTIHMAIKYIKKTGLFCEACSDELLRHELAVRLDVNRKLVREENGDPNHFSLQDQSFQHFSSNTASIAPNRKIRRTELI